MCGAFSFRPSSLVPRASNSKLLIAIHKPLVNIAEIREYQGAREINRSTLQIRCAFWIGLVLMTAACALVPERPEWPENLPPRSYYVSRYAADHYNQQYQSEQEYLLWVKRFYAGWGGIQGWHSIREEILADVSADSQARLREELHELGRRVSAEWAKESDRRVIVNQTVQAWINAAYEAGTRGDHWRLLRQISGDLDALLAGTLDPSVITLGRYYPDAEQRPAVGSLDSEADNQP